MSCALALGFVLIWQRSVVSVSRNCRQRHAFSEFVQLRDCLWHADQVMRKFGSCPSLTASFSWYAQRTSFWAFECCWGGEVVRMVPLSVQSGGCCGGSGGRSERGAAVRAAGGPRLLGLLRLSLRAEQHVRR